MSHTVNSRKREVSAVFEVSGQVAVGGPGSPLVCDGPGLLLDPSASAESRHSSIGVARVVHQTIPVRVTKKDVVDPD